MAKFPSRHAATPGVAFGDQIFNEKIKRKRSYDSSSRSSQIRGGLMLIFILVSTILIAVKLLGLQILQGAYYKNLSNSNRIRTQIIHAPRGTLFDRNGKALVYNVPGYREEVDGKTKLLTQNEAVPLIAKGKKDLDIDSLRQYPYKEVASHVLGYIGQISPEELKKPEYLEYGSSDLIGEMGIERQYERDLRGVDGKQLIEVDNVGNPVRKLGQTDPTPGKNIKLTLDIDVQKAAFTAMKDVKKGSVVVSKPDGEILAMVSKPSFDPNLFTMGSTYKAASESGYTKLSDILLDGDGQPLLDRAISGTYPPGSTFKIVNASTGLADKIIDSSYTVNDTGVIKIGEFSFANWYFTQYGRTDGSVDVVKALQRSNDIFFYKLAEKIGVNKLSSMANNFGGGKELGIDIPGESSGLVPTPGWKEKVIGEPWYTGDTYHYGIGQGYLLSTPLQVNAWAQIIANNGTLFKPHILMAAKPFALKSDFLTDNTIDLVRQGMINACAPGGVAWPFFNYTVKNSNLKVDNKNILEAPKATTSANFKDYRHVVVACKTGTAQHGDESTLPHAWITLYAPAFDPQIVVTVLAESSGEGSNIAAPVAKKILDQYFENLK